MTFDKSFTLSQMADDARKRFDSALSRVDRIDETLDKQMNGKSVSRISGSAVVSLIWLVAYIFLFYFVADMLTDSLPATIALISSLVLMLLMLVETFIQLRYYGSISQTRSRLAGIRGRIEADKHDLSSDLSDYLSRRGSGWNLALEPGNPVDEDLDDVEQGISGIVAIQSGILPKLRLFAYYVTCLAWAVAGSFSMEGLLHSLLGGEFSNDTLHVMLLVGMVITVVAEYFVAKLIWSMTDCAVTNLTLFATIAGPIIFCLLALAAALVVAVVSLILSLLAGLMALIIGGAFLSGLCSGG